MATSGTFKLVKDSILQDPGLPRPNPTASVWQEPQHPSVANAQSPILADHTDVIIIGAGITGCSVARSLLQHPRGAGLHVTVLEARSAVSGATGRNGGHLISDTYLQFSDLAGKLGHEAAVKILRFTEENISQIKELVQAMGPQGEATELREVTQAAGVSDPGLLAEAKNILKLINETVPDRKLGFDVLDKAEATETFHLRRGTADGVVLQRGAAALWPYRLITAIFENLCAEHKNSFALETHTPVLSIEHQPDTDTTHAYKVVTPRGTIRAGTVIHCTNGFSAHLLPGLRGLVYPLRGTMSAQQPGPQFPRLGDRFSWSHFAPPSHDPAAGRWSTGLHYAQQNAESGTIFIGGEVTTLPDMLNSDDSVVGDVARASIENVLPRLLEDVEPVTSKRVWSGIMGFTADGRPLVGRLGETLSGRRGNGEWLAAGFCGHGMDKCWLTGKAVAEMVLGEDIPPWFPEAFLLDEQRLSGMSVDMSAQSVLHHFGQ